MEVRRRVALAGGATAASFTLAACGGSFGFGASASSGISSQRVPTNTAPVGAVPQAATAERSLRAMTHLQLGRIIMNGGGRTLYRYDQDSANPPRSNCIGACAQSWPPARWVPGMKITGVNRAIVGQIRRPDGTMQLTVGGWPMYLYAMDTAPGEARGQGQGGVWWVSKPNGAKTQASAGGPAEAGAGDGTGGAYGGGTGTGNGTGTNNGGGTGTGTGNGVGNGTGTGNGVGDGTGNGTGTGTGNGTDTGNGTGNGTGTGTGTDNGVGNGGESVAGGGNGGGSPPDG